jgi:predicted dehydrogenase/threonine dehydrogenase-like Zn-dependent dehydrogenase
VKNVIQPVRGGPVEVIDVPVPVPSPTEVLVATIASVISPGTERAVTALAQSSLLAKARARPDLVRQVASKARSEGLAATTRAVRSRLGEYLPLGYSAAGRVVGVGEAVDGIRTGQLVATGGAGKASHAQFQAVPGLLCAVIPDGVTPADAAFTTVASIALHGLRLAEAGPGSKVVVVGLGLVGQLAARLAMAAGCDVTGIDPDPQARAAAAPGMVALDELGDATTAEIMSWSRGRGADAVLVCAATRSSDPVLRATALCRDRAPLVVVGDVGLELDRRPLYEKEISLRFARSYGPGRYDASYESWGVDYPAGQVRWTEGRNQEAVLDLMAAGRLQVADLVTHTFGIEDAAAAYQLIETRAEPYLAIQITYPPGAADEPVIVRAAPPSSAAEPGVGWVGAGAFSTGTLMPAFRDAGFSRFTAVASASGLSSRRAAERHGFSRAVSGGFSVIDDADTSVVVIATPHDMHAELAILGLKAGRHVWCEKPLALTEEELDDVTRAWQGSGCQLAIGFNRRWSPAVRATRQALSAVTGPRLLVYRVAAGPVPDGHWYRDPRQGGRVLGEVCHFVDTAQALIGSPIEEAAGLPGGGAAGDDVAISLRFADGSLATIAYGSVPPAGGKEWIEISAGSGRVTIDDFRRVTANGKVIWKGRQDKGHRACVAAFRAAVTGKGEMPTETLLASMAATIQAATLAVPQPAVGAGGSPLTRSRPEV